MVGVKELGERKSGWSWYYGMFWTFQKLSWFCLYLYTCMHVYTIWLFGTIKAPGRTSTCEKTNWGKPFWNALILQETTCHLFQLHTWGSASDVRRVFTELKQKHTVTGNWPVGIEQWEKHLKGRAFVFLKIGNICHDTWCWDGFSKKELRHAYGQIDSFLGRITLQEVTSNISNSCSQRPGISDHFRIIRGFWAGDSPLFQKNL